MPKNTDAPNPSSSSPIEPTAPRNDAQVLAPGSNDSNALAGSINVSQIEPTIPDNSARGGM